MFFDSCKPTATMPLGSLTVCSPENIVVDLFVSNFFRVLFHSTNINKLTNDALKWKAKLNFKLLLYCKTNFVISYNTFSFNGNVATVFFILTDCTILLYVILFNVIYV